MSKLKKQDWMNQSYQNLTPTEKWIITDVIKTQKEIGGVLSSLTEEGFMKKYNMIKNQKKYWLEFLTYNKKYYQFYSQEIHKILENYN
jgi:hypothetical protein